MFERYTEKARRVIFVLNLCELTNFPLDVRPRLWYSSRGGGNT
jgi:hypothetical protein